MSCRGKAMHALGECDCYFKPANFLDLLQLNREWFQLLIEVGCAGGNIAKHQVRVMLVERTRWPRNSATKYIEPPCETFGKDVVNAR
jgi:hypothetical protein